VTVNLNARQSAERRGGRVSAGLTLAVVIALAFSTLAKAPPIQSALKTPSGFAPDDLSGVWMERQNAITFSPDEPPFLPWAAEKYRSAKPGYGPRATANSEDPILNCLPPGVPRIMLIPFPVQIVQSPGEVIMLFEYDHYIRHVYLDRRSHAKELDVSWMGDSIGWWEGDTLVIDTAGLNDRTWLDQVGHPHSDALHVIERLRRTDRDTLQDDLTIDDPKAYKKPWIGRQVFTRRPTWHLLEYVCSAEGGARK
jgi:hypothetical protein